MVLHNTLFVCGPITPLELAFLYGGLSNLNFYGNSRSPLRSITTSLFCGCITAFFTVITFVIVNPGYFLSMVISYTYLVGIIYRMTSMIYTYYTGLVTKHTCVQCNRHTMIEITFPFFKYTYCKPAPQENIVEENVVDEYEEEEEDSSMVENESSEEYEEDEEYEEYEEEFSSPEQLDDQQLTTPSTPSSNVPTDDIVEAQPIDEQITTSSEEKPMPLNEEE